jgi:Chaperone of endosialidase
MANKTRLHANFATGSNLYVDTANSRVGVGTTVPSTTLQVSGTITCTDINSTSDIKLKENIHSIDNPLDKVMQINGVAFNWKDTKEAALGVIAQDIEEVLPELVKENEHHKSVNYNGLIGVLIEAVKEQQRQILELKAQLNDK